MFITLVANLFIFSAFPDLHLDDVAADCTPSFASISLLHKLCVGGGAVSLGGVQLRGSFIPTSYHTGCTQPHTNPHTLYILQLLLTVPHAQRSRRVKRTW